MLRIILLNSGMSVPNFGDKTIMISEFGAKKNYQIAELRILTVSVFDEKCVILLHFTEGHVAPINVNATISVNVDNK